LATLGEMATGMAHEINQPLNVIRIASDLIIESIMEDEIDHEFIKVRAERIQNMVDRAAKIIQHLKTFARRADSSFENIIVNQAINNSIELLSEKLRCHSIEIKLNLDIDPPVVYGDLNSLEQVFINLLINSIDAFDCMDKKKSHKCKIKIETKPNRNTKNFEILFKDNGPGISSSHINRIFDPFFTTKEVGRGTGLGLSISYGIIKSHGGNITVKSNKDRTIFKIEIPITLNNN
jgi:histidine kinase